MKSAFQKLSMDSVKVHGNTHDERNPDGTTGVQLGNNVEVEDKEVLQSNPDGSTTVYSNRLIVPGTQYTFAQYAEMLNKDKAKYEKRLITEVDNISETLGKLDRYHPNRKNNSTIRTAEKQTLKSAPIGTIIQMYNEELEQLFAIQDQMKQQIEQQEQQASDPNGTQPIKMAYGGVTKFFTGVKNLSDYTLNMIDSAKKENNMLGFQKFTAGAQLATSFIGGLYADQMLGKAGSSTIPSLNIPSAPKMRTSFSVGQQLKDIDNSDKAVRSFISSNSSNSNTARAQIQKVAFDSAAAKARVLSEQFNIETGLKNQSSQMNFQRDSAVAQSVYNTAMQYLNRDNQLTQGRIQNTNNMLSTVNKTLTRLSDIDLQILGYDAYSESAPRGVQATMNETITNHQGFGNIFRR